MDVNKVLKEALEHIYLMVDWYDTGNDAPQIFEEAHSFLVECSQNPEIRDIVKGVGNKNA